MTTELFRLRALTARSLFLRLSLLGGAALLAGPMASAQNLWLGVPGVSATTNWSDTLNWFSGTAPAGESVLFQDNGAIAVGVVNNVVDGAFAGSASSLQYANTNNAHTTLIGDGTTLPLTGALIAGTEVATDITGRTNTITGAGGALVAISPGANFIVRQWPVAGTSSASRTTLDLSGLGTFTGTFDRLLIGVANSGGGNRATGRLLLARTNILTLGGADPQIDLGDSAGNNGNGSQLYLGQTNAFFANTLTVGRYKERAVLMSFQSGLSNPTLYLRGADGSSRVNSWIIGYMGNGSATANAQGTVDLSAGSLNAQVETLDVGRASDYTGGSTTTGPGTGGLTINAGTLDVNTLRIGYQPRGTSAAGTTGGQGTLNVNGSALVLVNAALQLGASTGGAGVLSTYGALNINGGTVRAAGISANAGGTNNSVTITGNGALVVTNTAGPGIRAWTMTNASLTVPVLAGSAPVIVTNLTVGGANTINFSDVPAVAAYPAQFTVIKYAGALGGTFNFAAGTFPPSSPAFAGYISNHTANSSIDLVLTAGTLPARALTWNGNLNGDWDTATANWLFLAAAASYNEEDFVRFDDTASGTTAINLTGVRIPTSVTVSNVAKAYGMGGGGSLSGATAIVKQGANTLYITNTGGNDFSGDLSIGAGTVQVGNGDLTGSLGPGPIANSGALTFARVDVVALPNVISGGGTLTQNGPGGTLTVSGANSYSGLTTVTQGTLQAGNGAAFGATNGGTIVAAGATLDFNGFNIGLEPVTVAGQGVGAGGALVNNGASIFPAVARVTLTGHTVFGGSGRWDLRSATTGNPNQSSLLTGGQPYKLIKVGANQVGIVGTTVDDALGDVEVQAGILGFEAAMTGLGNSQSNLIVWPGAQIKFFDMTNHLNKQIRLGGDGATASVRNDQGVCTVAGPITLTNDCIFAVDAGSTLNLNGPLNGAGALVKNDAGTLVLNVAATHGGTVVNVGKLVLNGSHTGGITNNATFAGTGTNTGFNAINGPLFPGDTNIPGQLTLHGLELQSFSQIFVDLGGSSNDLITVNGDLIVNGNTITVNPQGLLAGNTYTVIRYTGSLIWNADLLTSGPLNYVFTVNTNTAGEIRLVVTGGPPIWNGGGTTDNWSESANWTGIAINPGDSLYFAGVNRRNNLNDTTPDTSYSDIGFTVTAGAFVLNGNSINLGGNIFNNSTSTQTVLLNLNAPNSIALSGGPSPGKLIIGGELVNTAGGSTTVTLGGTGILTNRLAAAAGSTNALVINDTNATWTLMNNATATAITNPTQLDIQAGTFNFGWGASAPVFASTTAGGVNMRIGALSGAPAVFNMNNGTLQVAARLNMGAAGNALATLNQSGGTISIDDVLQGSDSAATCVSTINVSGGTLSVGESEASPNSLFLSSRGSGTLNVSGTGLVRCGVLDVSRNASAASSTGVINLDGGTIDAQRLGTGTSSFSAGGTPTATLNFNGGVLKARDNSTTFVQGRAEIPITSIVKAGGAIVDSAGFNITILEPLQHDSGLGGTPDGGLVKLGTGLLTLPTVNTYTGPTAVSNGTLLLNGTLTASAVKVATGGTLAGNGQCGLNLEVEAGGTVSPGTSVGILTVTNGISLGGVTFMEVHRTLNTNDLLRSVTGNLAYGGTLTVTNLGGVLTNGVSFKLFDAVGYAGGFSALQLPGLGAGQSWNTSQLTANGTITVVGNPGPPSITSVSPAGGNLVITGSGGVTNGTYQLLTATNVVQGLAVWTVVGNGQFDGNGNFGTLVAINPATPQRYFTIRLQ